MSPRTPAETTQVSKVELPNWVEKASKSNYEFARKISNKPMPIWKGDRVADQSNMTTDAFDYLMKNVGAQDPLFENAAALNSRAATELDPIYANAQGILSKVANDDSWDPSAYLNPYTGEVEQRAIANAERSLDQSIMQAGDKARKAGAFGGSASAIEKGVLAAEGARGIGDLSAELRRAGYDKATADMLADRAQKGEFANSMIAGANTQAGNWLNAASGFLDTAKGRGAQVAADTASMLSAGDKERAFRQQLIDAEMAKFYEKRDKPLERLNIRLAALGMSPYGKTETTTKTGTSESQGPDFATMGLGILQMLPALLSDRRDKKDIEELGEDPETGIPIYAYRYKDAPAGSPKIVGPMAQDIEKVAPHLVTEIGGHKVIKGLLAAA